MPTISNASVCIQQCLSLPRNPTRAWQETGASVMFVTHDLDEAAYLADKVVLLGGCPARIVREMVVALPHPRAVMRRTWTRRWDCFVKR